MSDIIVAVATPRARSAIGLVRLSGSGSIELVDDFFVSPNRKKLSTSKSSTVVYGFLRDKAGTVIDEVLVSIFRSPFSYTKEDVVEISCHGNPLLLDKVVALFTSSGARMAERGEFTMRAFLNGRIDLTQAQAVLSLINANSHSAMHIAANQLAGTLSRRLVDFSNDIKKTLVKLDAFVEFPEDLTGLDTLSLDSLLQPVKKLVAKLETLLSSAELFSLLEEGVKIQLVGSPNVGKSTLFNSLLGEERAIVYDLSGTTRDLLYESIYIEGIKTILIDSAGLVSQATGVDLLAIEKTKKVLSEVWGLIVVLEADRKLTEIEKDLLHSLRHRRMIIFINKIDLVPDWNNDFIKELGISCPVITGSAKTGQGLDSLRECMKTIFIKPFLRKEKDIFILRDYQVQQLIVAKNEIVKALEICKGEEYIELVIEHLKCALECFSKILGVNLTDEVISDIFSEFCIGK